MTRSFNITRILLVFIYYITLYVEADQYPIIIELEGNEVQCYHISFRDSESVTFLGIPLPHGTGEKLEEYYYDKIIGISSSTDDLLNIQRGGPSALLDETPQEIRDQQRQIPKENRNSVVEISLNGFVRKSIYEEVLPFMLYHKTFHAVKLSSEDAKQVCFSNHGSQSSSIVFSYIQADAKKVAKKEHLKPIERSFDLAIARAKQILSEIGYLERRESRMKHTADSTNARVRRFSYASLTILLGVSAMQIRYLKSFFKKKKIL